MDGNATEDTNVPVLFSSKVSIALIIFLGLFDIASIIANGMVLITVYGNPRLRSNTNFFITNLCLVDLISGLVLMPLVIDSIARQEARFGVLCKLVGFIDAAYSCASSLTIAVIALDRYHSIVNCLYYENIVTRRRTIIAIVWIWFQTLLIALCPIAGWGHYSFDFAQSKCSLHLPDRYGFLWFMFCTSVVLPFIVIVFCYTQIHLVARRHAKNMVAIHIHDTGKRIKAVSTRKTKLVYLVVGLYTVCWLPIYIVKLLQSVVPGIGIPTGVITLAMVLSLVNCSCNPFLYALITSQYRAGMNRMYKRYRRKFGRPVATPSVDQSKSSWSVSRPISNLYRYFQENDAGNMLACIGRTDDEDREQRGEVSHSNPKSATPSPSNQRRTKPQTLQIPQKSKNGKRAINGWVAEKDKHVDDVSLPLRPMVSGQDDKNISYSEHDVSSESKPLARTNSWPKRTPCIKERNTSDSVHLGVTFKSQTYLKVIAVIPDNESNCRPNSVLSTIEEVDNVHIEDNHRGNKVSEVDLCREDTTWEDKEMRTKESENIGTGNFKRSSSDGELHINMTCENMTRHINVQSAVSKPLDVHDVIHNMENQDGQETTKLVKIVKDLHKDE